jgi:hypothetical protein
MITNIERLDTPDNIELYKVTCSNSDRTKKKKPAIKMEFENDRDLFDYLIDHIAFIPDEEKSKFTVDIQHVVDEELFCKKSVEAYEKHMKSPGD